MWKSQLRKFDVAVLRVVAAHPNLQSFEIAERMGRSRWLRLPTSITKVWLSLDTLYEFGLIGFEYRNGDLCTSNYPARRFSYATADGKHYLLKIDTGIKEARCTE